MELRRLTMTFLRDMAMAPLERQTETIIGSISGVKPTATANAKKKASFQSCVFTPLMLCVFRPLMRKTNGTMTAMKRSMSQVNFLMPLSKLVSIIWVDMLLAIVPKYVCAPVSTTKAWAEPLSTLVPRKQRLDCSSGATFSRVSRASNFSTGNDSPVSVAWIMKRSLEVSTLTSPGTMSPAQSLTKSPDTNSCNGTSRVLPSRTTVAVTRIIALSLAAAASARDSWMNRNATPKTTIATMIQPPARLALVLCGSPGTLAVQKVM